MDITPIMTELLKTQASINALVKASLNSQQTNVYQNEYREQLIKLFIDHVESNVPDKIEAERIIGNFKKKLE